MSVQDLKNYLINNDIDVQSAHAAFGPADWVFRAYSDSAEITGVDYDHVHCYFGPGADVFYQFISLDDIKKVSKKFYEDYLKNPESMQNKIQTQRKIAEEIDHLGLEYLEKAEEGVSDAEFARYFRNIIELGYEWWKYATIGEDKAEVVNWEIVPRFQRRHGIDYGEAREAVSVLAHPDEMAVFNQESKKFFEICLVAHQKMKVDEKLVQEYLDEFFYMRTNFYEAVQITADILMNDVHKEIKTRNEEEIKNEINKIDENFSEIHNRKKMIRDSYVLSEEDLVDIEFSQSVILWFDQRKLGMMKQLYYIYSMMREIPARKNVDYHTCTLYFMEELFDLLEKNKQIDPSVIEERENGVFLAFEKGKRIEYFSQEAEELFTLASKVEHTTDLKGVVASRGGKEKVRGVVNIVLRPDKNYFEEGKILVTSMTRIEFVPLMKKALAIVTNEGGLACHAAIVSREMGLPAIINTKNATKVLKDGDEIEMDLKTGAIRII